MTVNEPGRRPLLTEQAGGGQRREGLLALGGVLGATACCIMPLALFSVGISGAWIGNLTAMMPYQPIFLVVAVGFVGAGLWRVYRRPKACDAELVCARPGLRRVSKVGLWSALVLVAAAIAYPLVAPTLLGV